ncbi:hypothetical protein GCM10027280_29060 [Micromonospora polyrhachis]|uniref:Uncharacterized protein n=1 Tax=Micromonospora polyrhachis TaxID=1282883 RepID=A0A7W7SQK3_9ACTN|nr:hypothetical protein [Micromonospora polyrhachis]
MSHTLALHTVKATAELVRPRGGQFVGPAKESRRALFDALNALPWQSIPITDSRIDISQGESPVAWPRHYPPHPTYRMPAQYQPSQT